MLRPYQHKAHTAIRESLTKGVNRQLLQAATGCGKTVLFAHLPEQLNDLLPGKTIVLAHREELIDQAISKIKKANPTLRVDKEMAANRADPSRADIIVASVATLGRKGTKRLEAYEWDQFDKFVVDEAHHATAQSYLNVFEAAGLFKEGDKRLLLGLTATPQRSDGQALAKLFQKIVFSYSMRQAIEEGWLVDVKGIRISTDTSLDSVKTIAGDFDDKSLAEAVNNPKRNQLIVKAWLDKGENRQTVGFTVDIQHAKDLAAMFNHYGVAAEAVWGDDQLRKDKLRAHKAGEFQVLLNCGVLTEGYDDWHIGCIILARPTKSGVLYVQMVGRGTRLEELADGSTPNILDWTGQPLKQDCIILDVVDASNRHSLVTLPTLMGMSAKLDLKGGSLVKAVKQLEDKQKQYQHVDFSKLDALDKLDAFIEHVDLFNVKFAPEVESNSKLNWHPAASGGFVLLLPDKDEVRIKQNMLDKWELFGIIRGKRYKGERETIEAVFAAADDLVHNTCPDALKILRREEKWHGDPATIGQVNLLRKLLKGKPIPDDLSKGAASKLISSILAGKA